MAVETWRRGLVLALYLLPVVAAAEQVLIERAPYRVSLPEQACAAQQRIRVVADAHQHLGYDNSDLKAVVRRAHAAVWLSCFKVESLCVEAYLAGSDIRVMHARAHREDDFDLKIAAPPDCTPVQAEATAADNDAAAQTLESVMQRAAQSDAQALHAFAQHYQNNPQEAVANDVLETVTGRPEQVAALSRAEKITLLELLAAREGSREALAAIRQDSLNGLASADYALGRLYAGDRQAKLPMDDAFLEQDLHIDAAQDRRDRATVAAYFFTQAARKGDRVAEQIAELAGLEGAQKDGDGSSSTDATQAGQDVARADEQANGGPLESGEEQGQGRSALEAAETDAGNAPDGRALEAGPVPGDALRPGVFVGLSQGDARGVVELALLPAPAPPQSASDQSAEQAEDAQSGAPSAAPAVPTSGSSGAPSPEPPVAPEDVPYEQPEGELIID
ncbi:hypothetical protein ATO7_01980 [Oceanococcus atlanticus]|uniref:Uncharacterized protein n=1 Tax=Oceanococcus atlanticus TaxID=1317117 RepID=A0A1Y1SG24_9GAMM|nr:hypothetical protein [Oceanococcus atlanticus]ORE88605.1 hypothetical protein ATO7_01980 [Oceanococcus atlanticus]